MADKATDNLACRSRGTRLFDEGAMLRLARKHSQVNRYLRLKKMTTRSRKPSRWSRSRVSKLAKPRRGRKDALRKHAMRSGGHAASAPVLPSVSPPAAATSTRGEFAFLDDLLPVGGAGPPLTTSPPPPSYVVGTRSNGRNTRRRRSRHRKQKVAATVESSALDRCNPAALSGARPASRGGRPGTRGSAGSVGGLAWRPPSRGSRPNSRGLFSPAGYLSSTSGTQGTGSRPASRKRSRGSRPRSRSTRRPRGGPLRGHRGGELQLGHLGVEPAATTDRTGATSLDTGRTEDFFTLFPTVASPSRVRDALSTKGHTTTNNDDEAFWGFASFAKRAPGAPVTPADLAQDAAALAPCSDGPSLFELMDPEAANALAHAERRRRMLRRRLHPADWDVPDPRLHGGLRAARDRAGVTFARVLEHRDTRQDDTAHPVFFGGLDADSDSGGGASTPGLGGEDGSALVSQPLVSKARETNGRGEAATDEHALREFFGLYPKIRRYQEAYGRDAPIGTGTPRSTYLGKCGELGLVPQPLGVIREDPTSIDLRHCGIGNKYGVALGAALAVDRQLTALNVRGNRLGGEGAAGILGHLPSGITTLDISYNPIGREGVAALVRLLADDTYLAELHVEGVGLDGEQVERLAVPLARQGSLLKLNLSKNYLGGGGGLKAFPLKVGFSSWRKSTKAQRRYQNAMATRARGGNDPGKRGPVVRAGKGRGAAAARKYNSPALRAAAVGVEALASAISRNSFLLELDLSWNNLHGEPAGSIMRALKRNKHLRVVDLSWNLLCTCTGEVAAMLRGNKEICHLSLSHNNFTRAHCTVLAAGLAANQTCCGLHFAGNAGDIDARGYLKPHPESERERSRREDEERQVALREAAAVAVEEARRSEDAGEGSREKSKPKKTPATASPKVKTKKRQPRGDGEGQPGGWSLMKGRGKALKASELQDRRHERRMGAAHVAAFGGRRRNSGQRRIVAEHHHRHNVVRALGRSGAAAAKKKKQKEQKKKGEKKSKNEAVATATAAERSQSPKRRRSAGQQRNAGDASSTPDGSSLSLPTSSSTEDEECALVAEGAAEKWRSRSIASRARREEARQSHGARRRRRHEARETELAKRRRKRERRRSKRARARRVKDGMDYSNCWICGRWSEVGFKWTPGESGPYCGSEGLRVSVHLAFENWRATPCKHMPGKCDHGYYAAYRVLPPGRHQYYYSVADSAGAASDRKAPLRIAAEDQPTERTVLDIEDSYSAVAAVAGAVEEQEAAKSSALKDAHRTSGANISTAAASSTETVAEGALQSVLNEKRQRLDAALLRMVQGSVARQAEQEGMSRRDALGRTDVLDRVRLAIAELKGRLIKALRAQYNSDSVRVTKDELVDALREMGFDPSVDAITEIFAVVAPGAGEIGQVFRII